MQAILGPSLFSFRKLVQYVWCLMALAALSKSLVPYLRKGLPEAEGANLRRSFRFLQDPNDLRFGESTLSHDVLQDGFSLSS